jgi:protein disulfide-isomerase A1
VYIGTSQNFDNILKENEHVLVEFYAPWCGHCKQLAPEYEKAAKILADEKSLIKLVKVDATVHADLGKQYQVSGYPTIYFFKNGAKVTYEGDRTADGIVAWLKKKSGPASTLVNDESELGTETTAYGVFSGESSEAYAAFLNVATTADDFKFAHKFGGAKESITIYPRKLVYEGDLKDSENIKKWIEEEGFPTLSELDQKSWKRTVMNKKSLFVGFIHPENDEKHAEQKKDLQTVADKYKGKYAVTWMDGVKNEGLASRWGATGKVIPTAILLHFAEGSQDPKFYIWNEDTEKEYNVKSISNFLDQTVVGKYAGFKKSEPIPESNDGPVKVVVGKQFEEIVFDKTKDVLLEFYAPWCGHCQKLVPIYDELGTSFKDSKNVVIAKIDATANSYPESISVRGFPTIMLFPAGDKENPIPYEGDRTFDAMKAFVNREDANTSGGSDEKEDL